jgi:hypothetical protein
VTSRVSSLWVNDIDLTPEQREGLARTGVIKLEGLMGPKALEFLRELCTTDERAEVTATSGKDDGHRRVMASRGKNIGNKHPVIKRIVRSPEFLRLMAHLVLPETLLFAKGMVFEVEPGDSGYGWHFGVKAFQFIRPTDSAYSMWIPLHDVDPRMGGGIAYVPADVWSGRERIKLISHLLATIRAAAPAEATKLVGEMAAEYPHLSFLTNYENKLLDTMRIEPSFELGDVFLFSRWVWHRSCGFLTAPLVGQTQQPRRVAYTMRFVDSQSRISRPFIDALRHYYELRKQGGKGSSGGSGGGAPFKELADGDLLSNSPDSFPVF